MALRTWYSDSAPEFSQQKCSSSAGDVSAVPAPLLRKIRYTAADLSALFIRFSMIPICSCCWFSESVYFAAETMERICSAVETPCPCLSMRYMISTSNNWPVQNLKFEENFFWIFLVHWMGNNVHIFRCELSRLHANYCWNIVSTRSMDGNIES